MSVHHLGSILHVVAPPLFRNASANYIFGKFTNRSTVMCEALHDFQVRRLESARQPDKIYVFRPLVNPIRIKFYWKSQTLVYISEATNTWKEQFVERHQFDGKQWGGAMGWYWGHGITGHAQIVNWRSGDADGIPLWSSTRPKNPWDGCAVAQKLNY